MPAKPAASGYASSGYAAAGAHSTKHADWTGGPLGPEFPVKA
jgi:hypothetical protein